MGDKLAAFDFKVVSKNIPAGVYEAFAAGQAKIMGCYGHIAKTADGYEGRIEGEKPKMEKIKAVLEKAGDFGAQIQKSTFSEIKDIKQYTAEKFEIKK